MRWVNESCLVVSNFLWPHGLYSPWTSPGQNTGVGSLSLLQGIFPTQGSNPGLPHGRQILYQLSHKRSPRIQVWVAYPFSTKSSQPRKWMDWYLVSNSHTTNGRCLFWLFSSLDLLAVNITGWGSRWLLYTKQI